jgi:hypothetical protein
MQTMPVSRNCHDVFVMQLKALGAHVFGCIEAEGCGPGGKANRVREYQMAMEIRLFPLPDTRRMMRPVDP